MSEHRVRLSDRELEIIVSALRARRAMKRGKGAEEIARLTERLGEMMPGNPHWRLGWTNLSPSPKA